MEIKLNIELKPCPFCGGKARLNWRKVQTIEFYEYNEYVYRVYVMCNKCFSRGKPVITKRIKFNPVEYPLFTRKKILPYEAKELVNPYFEKAAEKWNRRE